MSRRPQQPRRNSQWLFTLSRGCSTCAISTAAPRTSDRACRLRRRLPARCRARARMLKKSEEHRPDEGGTMRVDVMTQGVQTISPDPIGRRMDPDVAETDPSSVVTRQGTGYRRLLDRDAGGATAPSSSRPSVADLMTAPVLTVPPETSVRKARTVRGDRSAASWWHGLAIRSASSPRRICSGWSAEASHRPVADRRQTLHHRAPHRKHPRPDGVW